MTWRERWESFDPIWKFALAGTALVTMTLAVVREVGRFERRLNRAAAEVATTYASTLETRELLMRWRLEEVERDLRRDATDRWALDRKADLTRLIEATGRERAALLGRVGVSGSGL
jgi:hypothetical protein